MDNADIDLPRRATWDAAGHRFVRGAVARMGDSVPLMRRLSVGVAVALAAAGGLNAQPARESVSVYAAGSLRTALTDLAQAFERETSTAVKLTFGPSGLLKERIEAGEAAQVFASANMSHPEALRNSGRAVSVQPFARNALCALGAASFSLQGKSLVQRLLDPEVRVGTSTPGADPAGDYAFQMFERIETSGGGAGAAATLKAKALQLTGGPRSASAPAGRSTYAMVMALGQADVFVTYCTNAAEARQELPSLQVITVPDEVNVAALYGIATLSASSTQSRAFVDFVRGPDGRKILARHGFSPP